MNTKRLTLGFVVLTILLIVAAVYTSMLILKRQAALREVSRYNATWLVSQGALEVSRLTSALAAFGDPRTETDVDEVRLRLDIVSNRIKIFKEGDQGQFIHSRTDLQATSSELDSAVSFSIPIIDSLEPNGSTARVYSAFYPLLAKMNRLAASVHERGVEFVTADLRSLENLSWIFSGLLIGLTLCSFGLIAFARWNYGMLAAAHDKVGGLVDQLRERERAAAEANNAKSGFLAMMSHEIRTPMNAVLGLAGSLLDDELAPAHRMVVEAIRDSGDDLLRILNDILDFSKLDANKMTFENAPFAPTALINSIVTVLSTRADAKGLRIVAEIDPLLPAGLLGDAGRIRQVLINLVSNAIKFTPSGRITVVARCVSADQASARVDWVVSDTGIGIEADRIGSLFSEFMQADSSISRRFGGTGLGLAISKRLVTQMDGTIEVESAPGHGSTFRVCLTLPVVERPPERAPRQPSVSAAYQAAVQRFGRTPRLLFAEDNPTNQFVARQLLKDVDIQIDMVSDGLEAVEAASGFAYDVICMDVQMPEMDGFEATRQIRSLGNRLAAIPIIALTANAFPEDVQACFDAGMDQFLSKPVSRADLLTALMRALFDDPGGSEKVAGIPLPTEVMTELTYRV